MIPHHCLFTLWLDELSGKNGCTGLSDALDPCMHPRYMHVQTGRQTGMHAYTLTLRMYTHTHTYIYIYMYIIIITIIIIIMIIILIIITMAMIKI